MSLSPDDFAGLVEKLYHYERTKEIAPWADLWAPDARVTFPADLVPGQRDVIGKETIVAWTAQKFVERDHTDIDARIEPMARGNRVLVHLNVMLHFANGTKIGGPLMVIFTFNDAGQITLMEEYVNEAQWPINYKEKAKPETGAV